MKLSYPLSVKVSLWLLLNLCLLATFAVGFFVVRGGFGWSALLAGPTSDLTILRGNSIAIEMAAAPPEGRPAILARASETYDAEFLLVRLDDDSVIGPALTLPAEVRARLALARTLGPGRDGGPRGGPPAKRFGPPGPRRGPPDDDRPPPREHRDAPAGGKEYPNEFAGPADAEPRRGPPDGFRGPPDPTREREAGRFLVRGGTPASFWIGTRTGLPNSDRRPSPAILIARIDSFWSLLRYLQLESWLLGGAAVLGLSVVFWLPLVGGITRALGQLTRATEQIADGRFDTRVPATRRDEIGQLGESVNVMAARLDTLVNGQRRFLGDVAHELGSPLARLQMATEILESRAGAALENEIRDVREEVQQMTALVNELLAFTKAGLRPRPAELTRLELAPLVQEVVNREAPNGGVNVTVNAEIQARADAPLLSRALGNLVRNALRYAGQAGPVNVYARTQDDAAIITIEDEGPGVPPDALARLGEPFYRPEVARTRETGGVGLGLAIVRSSVAACGGEVHFENRSPHGFRAEVRLAIA